MQSIFHTLTITVSTLGTRQRQQKAHIRTHASARASGSARARCAKRRVPRARALDARQDMRIVVQCVQCCSPHRRIRFIENRCAYRRPRFYFVACVVYRAFCVLVFLFVFVVLAAAACVCVRVSCCVVAVAHCCFPLSRTRARAHERAHVQPRAHAPVSCVCVRVRMLLIRPVGHAARRRRTRPIKVRQIARCWRAAGRSVRRAPDCVYTSCFPRCRYCNLCRGFCCLFLNKTNINQRRMDAPATTPKNMFMCECVLVAAVWRQPLPDRTHPCVPHEGQFECQLRMAVLVVFRACALHARARTHIRFAWLRATSAAVRSTERGGGGCWWWCLVRCGGDRVPHNVI